MAKKTHYVVDEETRTISFVMGTLTPQEEQYVDKMNTWGYTIVVKQKEAGLTYDKMKKMAKGKPYEKELLAKIAAKENYAKTRAWLLAKEKELKDAKKKNNEKKATSKAESKEANA